MMNLELATSLMSQPISGVPSVRRPRISVIACDVLQDEIELLTAQWDHIVAVEYLPMGLHDRPALLLNELQGWLAVAENDPQVDAVVLIYGLCGNGTVGLSPRRVDLVLPRAHDCVTLYMGSAERYAAYQREHPDAYYFTPGWMRGKRTPGPERLDELRREYAERFDDPDDVDFLIETERAQWARHGRAAYVDLGLPNRADYPQKALGCAHWLGWKYDSLKGDPVLLRDTLAGDWDIARHLVVHPGESIQPSYGPSVMTAKRADPDD